MELSQLLDSDNPNNNMYGCAPCPKCKSKYRWPMNKDKCTTHEAGKIICDECGFLETWVEKETIEKLVIYLTKRELKK